MGRSHNCKCNGKIRCDRPRPFAQSSFRDTGALTVGRAPAVVLQAGLIVAAGSFVLDQFNATQIDAAVIDGYRLINPPYSPVELDRIRTQRGVLGERLQRRPDDPEGLRLLCRLAEAELRWNVIQNEDELDFTDQKEFTRIWNQATLRVFLRELQRQLKENPTDGEAKRRSFQAAIADADLVATLNITQRRYPFTPELPMMCAAAAVANDDKEELERQVELLRFTWPSKSDSLFETGAICLLADRKDLTELVWQDSLRASNYCRSFMLGTAIGHWSQSEALQLFGPSNYADAVDAALKGGGPAVWERAEVLWSELEQPVVPEAALLRVRHLEIRHPAGVLQWLEKILQVHSENVPLLTEYAKKLDKAGRRKDALAEWHRIQYLDPQNEAAKKAIEEPAKAAQR